MHMADALLSPVVGGAMSAVSAGAIGYAVHKIKKEELSEKKLPVMAVMGAFVFAAQMINFTIPGTGSSGHIGGGVLLAAMLGGFPALLTEAAVLIIQCLFFADGGLLALGCNIFNMGVIPCLVIYPLLFQPVLQRGLTAKRLTVASILSVVIGLELGAFAVVVETLVSGITALPFGTFAALMLPIHLAIGVVEGIVTAGILCFVLRMRPELLQSALGGAALDARVPLRGTLAALAAVTLLVGGGLSLAASSHPDGLEWSMEKVTGTTELSAEGEVHRAAAAIQERTVLLPDYDFAQGGTGGTTVAGIAGAVLTTVLAGGAGFVVVRLKKRAASK